MKNFNILIPCYNDWDSVTKLLDDIDKEISNLEGNFSVLIVNDGSDENLKKKDKTYSKIKSVKVLNMKKNQGHTRSNATGLRFLNKKVNFDYLIVMDGDGEDRANEIKLFFDKVMQGKNISIVAKRIKRSEGLVFTVLYNLHKIITLIFTGHNINFGHYTCLKKEDVEIIASKKSLWGNFSGTVKRFIKNLDNIPCIRGKRYVQPSKMSFFKLIIHSFSIIAVFKFQVLLRSVVLVLILNLFWPSVSSYFLQFFIILFAIIVFIISRRENAQELENSDNEIENIETLYTSRL